MLHGHLHALAPQEGVDLGTQPVVGLFDVCFDPQLVPYCLGQSHNEGVLALGLMLRLEHALLVARQLAVRIVIVLGIMTAARPVLVVVAVLLLLLKEESEVLDCLLL